jgi:hypothetical protein
MQTEVAARVEELRLAKCDCGYCVPLDALECRPSRGIVFV